jgi:hypothetical protein
MRGFLSLNVYGHPSGFTFDPADVVRQVQQAFPGTCVDPRDQLAEVAQSAQQAWPHPSPPMQTVLDTLHRNAKTQGPAYSFTIACGGQNEIKGVAKRHLVQLGFEEPLDDNLRQRLKTFLWSLVPGLHDIELEED